MIEDILELARKGADGAEAYLIENETTNVVFEAGKPGGRAGKFNRADVKNSVKVIIRCFTGGRVGYASSTNADNPEELVKNALATAAFGRKALFEFRGGEPCAEVKVFDARVATLPVDTMVETGETAVSSLLEADSTLNVKVDIEKVVGRRRIINSAAMDRTEEYTGYGLAAGFTRAREGDIFEVWDYDASSSFDIDAKGVTDRLITLLRWADKTVPLKTGIADLVVHFAEVPTLLMPLIVGLNGENVARGSSPLVGKLGEKILDENFTLLDDPTIDYRAYSNSFDGEGTARRKLTLVEKGRLASYLLDLSAAAELGKDPTGNARRGGAAPFPSPSNVVVAGGDYKTYDELVASTDNGIIALALAGAQMGNLLGGEVSASIWTGLKVEKGEVVGRVKNTIFSGNIYEMLGARLKATSADVRTIGGAYTVPAFVIADQLITGSG